MRDVTAEQNLVVRLRRGDEAAVAELSSTYGSKIYQLAFRYMKNREDAEEIAQDVLLKVYQKIAAFRGDAALSSWIYRITFNTAMSRLRNARYSRPAGTSDERSGDSYDARERRASQDVADWSTLADDHVMRAQLRDRLVKALLELPPIYRAPVILRDIRGLSTEEASAILGVKDQTLKSRLHRGRLILRDCLADFAGGLSLHRPLTIN